MHQFKTIPSVLLFLPQGARLKFKVAELLPLIVRHLFQHILGYIRAYRAPALVLFRHPRNLLSQLLEVFLPLRDESNNKFWGCVLVLPKLVLYERVADISLVLRQPRVCARKMDRYSAIIGPFDVSDPRTRCAKLRLFPGARSPPTPSWLPIILLILLLLLLLLLLLPPPLAAKDDAVRWTLLMRLRESDAARTHAATCLDRDPNTISIPLKSNKQALLVKSIIYHSRIDKTNLSCAHT